MSNYNSKLILAKNILLDKTHKNVLNYSTNDMLTLLRSQGHIVGEASNYSFIQNGKISVGFTYSQCLTANYIAYQNPNYSSKWFFAFIDRVEYESNKSTIIYYTIDNWATWFDNLTFKPCYVVREHVNDDTIGANTIDEGLAVPDVEQANIIETTWIDSETYICVATNWDIDSEQGYNGVSGFNYNVFGQLLCFFDLTEDGLDNLHYYLYITNRQGHIEDVHDMFIVPKCIFTSATDLLNKTVTKFLPEVTTTYKQLNYASANMDAIFFRNVEVTPNYNYGTDQPRNNKCFVYPFNFLQVSNNIGSQNILKFEDFGNVEGFPAGTKVLQVQMALSIGMSGRIVPVRYKERAFNYDEAITLAKFPTCSWSADSYTNWLTDNAVNIGQRIVNTGANMVTGNLVGATSGIASLLGEFRKSQLLPEITGGQATGDVNFGNKNNHFTIVQYRIKSEYLKQIDDYFTRFGYKVIRVKVPNITGRPSFNYIEIGQGERFAYGEVPPESLTEINMIAQNGLTIWHNHANVGNYSVNNSIV